MDVGKIFPKLCRYLAYLGQVCLGMNEVSDDELECVSIKFETEADKQI